MADEGSGGSSSSTWGEGGSSSSGWGDDYGVREFANLLMQLLAFYKRHSAVINLVIPENIAAAFTLLVSVEDHIEALNRPGPD